MNRPLIVSMAVIALVWAPTGGAQTGVIEGAVNADSLGHRTLPGAQVSIPALQLTTVANFAGEYRFEGVAAGRYLVIATAVGLRSVGDSLTVAAGRATYHEFVLAMKAVVLDSVVSRAPKERTYISPSLNAFEERRASGSGGYFIGETQLRKDEGRQLSNEIVAHIPDVNMTIGGSLLSGRVKCKGPRLNSCVKPDCFVTVFVDGVPIWASAGGLGQGPPPNFTRMQTDEYAGIEYYAGGATLPAQFSGAGNECGVLLMWTRER